MNIMTLLFHPPVIPLHTIICAQVCAVALYIMEEF